MVGNNNVVVAVVVAVVIVIVVVLVIRLLRMARGRWESCGNNRRRGAPTVRVAESGEDADSLF